MQYWSSRLANRAIASTTEDLNGSRRILQLMMLPALNKSEECLHECQPKSKAFRTAAWSFTLRRDIVQAIVQPANYCHFHQFDQAPVQGTELLQKLRRSNCSGSICANKWTLWCLTTRMVLCFRLSPSFSQPFLFSCLLAKLSEQ